MRTTSYPSSERDWVEMLATPVSLCMPADFGLALAPYEHRGKRSPLGLLMDAYRFDGDRKAGRLLSEILERWLLYYDSNDHFDLMTTIPAPYTSGPEFNAESLLRWPGRNFDLRLQAPMWNRSSASAGLSRPAGLPEWAEAKTVQPDAAVARRRILVVLMCLTRHDDLVCRLHELYAQGAARVGVLAICDQSEVADGR